MPTIKEIAKICGVSVSTVSYALQDKESTIKESTKQRVREVAKSLNYIPNANAVRLKSNKNHQIVIFVPGFRGYIHPTILAGVAHVLRTIESPYNMIVTFCDSYQNPVTSNEVDLAIVMDSSIEEDLIRSMANIVPVITFDQEIRGDNIYSTGINQDQAITDLISYYLSQGIQRIGFIQGSFHSFHNKVRFEAYKQALNEHGIRVDNSIVYSPDAFTELKGYEVIYNNLKNNDTLPFEALMACNDELAFGAMNALSDIGFNAPIDYQISGFDNVVDHSQSPKLTTIEVDWFEYGIKIGKLTLDILNDKQPPQLLTIDCNVIYKESTK